MPLLRSIVFNAGFYGLSFLFFLCCLPLTALPSPRPVRASARLWARGVRLWMRLGAGISVRVHGLDKLPRDGRPVILACKHQSECDGIILMSEIPDVAFIAMRELERLPLVGPFIRKLDMVLVDTGGGADARSQLLGKGGAIVRCGRPLAIYPEGTLTAVGKAGNYRSGLYHLARATGATIVPVATNVGLFWDRRQPVKKAGHATVRLLDPIDAGPDKDVFMDTLRDVIETETARLVTLARIARSQARNRTPSVREQGFRRRAV